MEHLGEKVHSFFDPVPLRAELTDSPTDFYNFHKGDHGWILRDNGTLTLNLNIQQLNSYSLEWSQTDFVQRWLFFEVLKKVLGHLPGFSLQRFFRKDADDAYWVTTKDLPKFIEKWLDYEENREEGRVRRLVHAEQVLQWAKNFVSKYCSVNSHDDSPLWPVDPQVSLSILVLGETLTWALHKIQEKTRFKVRGWRGRRQGHGWGYSKLALEKLKEGGWCKKTISILLGRLRGNTIGLLYAFCTGQSGNVMNHRLCTPTHCNLSASPDSQDNGAGPKYKTSHSAPHCDRDTCILVGPDDGKLADILRSGKIPLFRYRDGGVELVEMGPSCNEEYAIFSHVWADGYGNPYENKLNRCVLEMFSGLFSDIRARKGRGKPMLRIELFWIDTLAIPVGRECKPLRKKAIRKMHDIYARAKYTIVLDAGLMSVKRGEGYVPPAMRIATSRWMTRLWTLPEAFLSKHLYFNFSDQVYSMNDLELLFEDENTHLYTCGPAVARTYYHGILGRNRREMRNPDLAPKSLEPNCQLVADVWKALQWRTTEHLQHETLALAMLLNVNTEPFADSSNTSVGYTESELDKRMRQFIDLLARQEPCAIPSGMIFLPGPRLSEDGYRWAPSSWLSAHVVDSPDPLAIGDKPARLRLPRGLEVNFPGFILHELGDGGTSPWSFGVLSFPVDISLLEWYSVRKADDQEDFPSTSELKDKRLAIIATRLPVVMDKEIALLVAGDKIDERTYYVKILYRVWLCRELDQEKLEKLRSGFRADSSGTMPCGEILPPDHFWCVDGPGERPKPVLPQTPISKPSRHKVRVDPVKASPSRPAALLKKRKRKNGDKEHGRPQKAKRKSQEVARAGALRAVV